MTLRIARHLLLVCTVGPLAASATAQAPGLSATLDSLVRARMGSGPVAGVSVAVVRGRDTVLARGYGFASLELQAPTTTSTTYRLLGPALAAAVMQQVEQGRFTLDDDVARLLPEFPWQSRRVTVRQLMDATSGLPDYHYFGDARIGMRAVPKAPDEVTALFAGRPFAHEPGERMQWTVSGFHLAGVLVERVSGKPFADYIRDDVIGRAGLSRSYHCDDTAIVPGLAQTYQPARGVLVRSDYESPSLFPYIATTCATALDAVSLMRALRDGRLLKPETYRLLSTPVGATAALAAAGQSSRGAGLAIGSEDRHRWIGERFTNLGFSGNVRDYLDDSLTIAVLSNTPAVADDVMRSLSRAALGLPALATPPRPERPAATAPLALPASERAAYVGRYRARYPAPTPPYAQWERSYRVFEWNGRLMIQALGDAPEELQYRGEGRFTVASAPAPFAFTLRDGRAVEFRRGTGSFMELATRIESPSR